MSAAFDVVYLTAINDVDATDARAHASVLLFWEEMGMERHEKSIR
jgi:hypothetical protein